MEALITIILSSIIVVISYSLFATISNQLNSLVKENGKELQYNLMNMSLLRDVNKAIDFIYNEPNLILYNYDDTIIEYHFLTKGIVRNTNVSIDTFKIGVEKQSLQIQKKRISLLSLKIIFLKSNINANYVLESSLSKTLNRKFFYEN
ncbi:hypothetical protein [Olleya sp. HaHaR_3_96]|uniref:hypothetical protein n=1 Tax=Olleya sp. HaHaR_3_96 TaxID=2745560 RepID=UPI001C501FEB|nr:hypothetical protein [Olleya sp. HaHaR_3_96]QXP58398.1 hypothetical protein H0I26_10750 [Olleya sp. HaHaR_3_96]